MRDYRSLSEAVDGFQQRGYTETLELKKDHIRCEDKDCNILVNDFEVDEMHRFEGMTNPSDLSIVYAISSEKHGVKGTVIDNYGPGSQEVTMDMAQKLKYQP